jgi:hypothetical protein
MNALGDQERAEGGDRGQSRLDQVIVRRTRERDRDETYEKPDHKPPARDEGKRARNRQRAASGRWIVRSPGENQREQNRRGAVVDQAFGFDQEPQAAGYP